MKSRYVILILILGVNQSAHALMANVTAREKPTSAPAKAMTPLKSAIINPGQQQHIRALNNKGKTASIRFNRRGTAEFIHNWTLKTSEPAQIRQFLQDNQILFKLRDANGELRLKARHQDHLQHQHEYYEQTHQGIPIWNRGLALHLNPEGKLVVMGKNVPTVSIPLATQAVVSEQQAVNTALQDLGISQAQWTSETLYLDHDGQLQLSHHITIQQGVGLHWDYFVHAIEGHIIRRISKIRHQVVPAQGQDLFNQARQLAVWQENNQYYLLDPRIPLDDAPYNPVTQPKDRGNFYILDAQQGNGAVLDFISSVNATGPWDPAGISAAYNVQRVYNYYKDNFQRNSFDNNNMNLQGIVHFEQNYNNAFWNGRSMVFGDGDGIIFNNMAGCLDITAHEMTHGVIQYTADFIYQNQSGALNESFADVFAAFVDGNWTLGEDCTLRNPGYLRSLEDPASGLSSQPSKMSEYVSLPNNEQGDFGGVHINSGIPNRAAYLIANQLGIAQAQTIYYRALTQYLRPESEFIQARRALVQAARDLFGDNSNSLAVINAAWDAVEVFDDNRGIPSEPVKKGILRVSTALLDFGPLSQGRSKRLSLNLHNDGDANLVITNITSDNANFIANQGAQNIAVGGGQEIWVTFIANEVGTQTGILNIQYQGQAEPMQVSLLGVGNVLALNTRLGKPGGSISLFFLLILFLGRLYINRPSVAR